MNQAVEYKDEQILNVSVFSSLYNWLYYLYNDQKHVDEPRTLSPVKAQAKSQDLGQQIRDRCRTVEPELTLSPESSSTRLNPKFRDVIIAYCLRLLSQVERDMVDQAVGLRVGVKRIVSNADWQREFSESVAMEAVRILDLLCVMDCALVSDIFPSIKKVYERTCQKPGFFVRGLVFSAVLQFLLNHSHHVIFDVDPVLHHFFGDYVACRYRRPLLAMSTLLFLTTNTSKLLQHTNVFARYYPAMLKLLAWHPRTVQQEAILLLPAMVGPSSSISLFHSLLDLPLTAAFMEHTHERESTEPDIEAYIMRSEALPHNRTIWDVERQVTIIQHLWSSLTVSPRVSSVCKLVPRFLRVYFEVLLANAPSDKILEVVPVLLQRFTRLFPVPFYRDAVHAVLIEALETIFQQWPSFLGSLRLDVVSAIRSCKSGLGDGASPLIVHLCWLVGDLLSPNTAGGVGEFFEALEELAIDICVQIGDMHASTVPPRVACVVISALTKLGTKFPEYAPRAILALCRMLRLMEPHIEHEGAAFVHERLLDCVQLSRHASIASSLYSLPPSGPLAPLPSSLSPLAHVSFLPHSKASGKSALNALHDFELGMMPPIDTVASKERVTEGFVQASTV